MPYPRTNITPRIEVKQHHILAGKRISCQRCPIALAVREAFGAKKDDFVFAGHSICLVVGEEFKMPPEIRDRMIAFDKYKVMYPFEFELCVIN